MTTPLFLSDAGIADANGRAVARISNLVAFEVWKVTRWTVSSTSTTETQARVYRNQESPSNFVEGTYSGKQDSSDTTQHVGSGEHLLCVWSSATPGSRCVFAINGERSR